MKTSDLQVSLAQFWVMVNILCSVRARMVKVCQLLLGILIGHILVADDVICLLKVFWVMYIVLICNTCLKSSFVFVVLCTM